MAPYTGFEHVELVVIRHNCRPPDEPPQDALQTPLPRVGWA
jgi:hypothetical protein